MSDNHGTAPVALAGIRILDLSTGIAGAFCCRLLAGFGADVYKVEPPEGDRSRSAAPDLGGQTPESSALSHYVNAGKRSVILDLRNAADRARLRALATACDAVVEDSIPGEDQGIGFEELVRTNPALVMTSITPFGQHGPYCGYAWTDFTISAWGGLLNATGSPDREPLVEGGYQTAYQCGSVAATATIAAVLGARRHGRGHHVDCSMMETVSIMLDANMYFNEFDPERGSIWAGMSRRLGRQAPGAPRGLWPCKDGWVMVIPRLDRPVGTLAALTGDERFADPRFQTPAGREEHGDEIVALLIPWLSERSREEIFHEAQAQGHYFGYLVNVSELMDSPQLHARGFFSAVTHPTAGTLRYPGGPAALSKTPWRVARAPLLGEHQDQISMLTGAGRGFSRGATGEAQAPLAGLRVLDLTRAWAGPLATKFLADWGADVVKVHTIRVGDAKRDPTRSAYWRMLDGNKRAIGIDFGTSQGQDLVRRLARTADVVVENFSPGVLLKYGLDYAGLSADHAALVMVSMPGFGSTGPLKGYRVLGETIEALSGLMSMTGYVDEDVPMKSGVNYGDPIAGITAAMAALAGLHHRESTGEGQWIDVSHLEAAVQWLGEWVIANAKTGELPLRRGNGSADLAPQGVYRVAGEDRWIAFSARDESEWAALIEILERPALASDPRFVNGESRVRHSSALDALLGEATSTHDIHGLCERLLAAGVPAAPVQTAKDLLTDPQHIARRFWSDATGPEYGVEHYLYNRSPAVFGGLDAGLLRNPPTFSQHLTEVLREWGGLDDKAIRALIDQHTVAAELMTGGEGLAL